MGARRLGGIVAAALVLLAGEAQAQPAYDSVYNNYVVPGIYQPWLVLGNDQFTQGVIGYENPWWLLSRPQMGYEVIPTGPNGYIYRPFPPQPGTPFLSLPYPTPPAFPFVQDGPAFAAPGVTLPAPESTNSTGARKF